MSTFDTAGKLPDGILHQLARIENILKGIDIEEKRSRQMTLHPQDEFSIPEETVRVAHAAYPKGNVYIKVRDATCPDLPRPDFCPPVSSQWSFG